MIQYYLFNTFRNLVQYNFHFSIKKNCIELILTYNSINISNVLVKNHFIHLHASILLNHKHYGNLNTTLDLISGA